MNCWRCKAVAAVVFVLGLATGALAGVTAPLSDAAERQDWARLRTLLKQHANVNAPQADGMTALHWAAYYDDLEIVRLLLRAGATARSANRYGVTPLSLACTNGN